MNTDNKEFLLALATLLEQHDIAICSRRVGEYSEVYFRQRESKSTRSNTIELKRLHISPYDLRCYSGMSSKEANDMYQCNKSLEQRVPLTIDESLIKDIATEFYYTWHNSGGTNTQQGFDDWWGIHKQRFIGTESKHWYDNIPEPVYCKMWDNDSNKYELGYVTKYTDQHTCDEIAGEYLFYDDTHACWFMNAVPVSDGLKHNLDKLGLSE